MATVWQRIQNLWADNLSTIDEVRSQVFQATRNLERQNVALVGELSRAREKTKIASRGLTVEQVDRIVEAEIGKDDRGISVA